MLLQPVPNSLEWENKQLKEELSALKEKELFATNQNKEVLKELNYFRERYLSLFNSRANAIAHCKIITDQSHKPVDFLILEVNDAYCAITGISKKLVEGKTGKEAFPGIENRSVNFIELYGKIALEGGELNFESYNEVLDQWYNVYVYSPLKDEFATIFTDITHRKRADKKLAADRELLEGIYNNIPVMITIFDPELKKFNFNKELTNTLGWTDKDGESGNFMEKAYPDLNARKEVEDFMKSLETGWKELRVTAKDGSSVESLWANVFLSNGVYVGLGVDIRKRKVAEKLLRESDARFSVIFESIPLGISLTEIETGKIIDVNEAGVKFSGCNHKDELIGKTTIGLNVIAADARSKIITELKQNGAVTNAEIKFKPLNQEERTVSLNLNKISINGKDHMLTTSMDITELKRLEQKLQIQNQQLKEAKEKAEENDKLKSIFLANMSHEIRTPMTGILGFTELLKAPDLTEDQKLSYVNIIESSGYNMLQILNDLIDISKIEAKQVEIHNQETDISKILNELNFFFHPEMSKKGINLVLKNNLPQESNFTTTDNLKLSQIISNLLKNALKFTCNGTIEFGCEIENNFYRFFVKDTGFGIPEDKLSIIFERFRQGDIHSSEKSEGVGLGLSISKAYVELLGGEIFVKSVPGKGSEFHFTLPVSKSEPKKTGVILPESDNLKLKDKKVLIAEDDESVFFLLNEILRRIGVISLHAHNGKEAVMIAQTRTDIDLIIMDTKMPILNGLEATHIIRSFNDSIPIIALSAFSTDADKQKALNMGCTDYLIKPMSKKALIDMLLLHIK